MEFVNGYLLVLIVDGSLYVFDFDYFVLMYFCIVVLFVIIYVDGGIYFGVFSYCFYVLFDGVFVVVVIDCGRVGIVVDM